MQSNYTNHPSAKSRGIDEEIWKDIPDYEGRYQASNWGRIKSLARTLMMKNGIAYRKKEKILVAVEMNQWGHSIVGLCKNGFVDSILVHRLVLLAFIGPCPEGMEACHIDGNPRNNRLDNLRWDTHKNNEKDKIRHGTRCKGEKHGGAKLTEEDVREIRKLWASGKYTTKQLGIMFGVCSAHISLIVRRKNWAHVE